MKIEELSIGDYVNYEGKPVRIKGLCSMVTFEINEHLICTCGVGCLDPIPLTPEILEKNGINKTYKSDEYAVYKGEGFNVTDYYTELWEFSLRRNRVMLKNVHELQHALRLAGIEKEIEV